MEKSLEKEIDVHIKKACKYLGSLNTELGNLARIASRYMEFPYGEDMSCEPIPGDGLCFCVELHSSTIPHLIPVRRFFEIVNEKGIVSIDDFIKNSI